MITRGPSHPQLQTVRLYWRIRPVGSGRSPLSHLRSGESDLGSARKCVRQLVRETVGRAWNYEHAQVVMRGQLLGK